MSNKIIIYQVLPRLYGNSVSDPVAGGSIERNGCGKFDNFTAKHLKGIKSLGITHIWYTGILEHATTSDYTAYGIAQDNQTVVKGRAGSPYAVKDYYDVDPDLATDVNNRINEFESLLERTHKYGLKAIIDFVPNHVARHYVSDAAPAGIEDFGASDNKTIRFSSQNNFYYIPYETFRSPVQSPVPYKEEPARATGNDRFVANPDVCDWYDTVKLNYGVDYFTGDKHFDPTPDTWKKMYDILDYWCAKGVDAFRCDMVEMVPVEFWSHVVADIKKKYPHVIFIAEIYNPIVYNDYVTNGGFDYLYDKVGLYNTLRDVVCGRRPASDITYCWQSVGTLQQNMLNFIENHDEQRLASDFYAANAEKGRAPMIVATLMNVNPVMVYFGQELGERGMDSEGYSGHDGRTSIYDYWSPQLMRTAFFSPESLDYSAKSLRNFYKTLLNIAKRNKAVVNGLFFDLTYCNLENPEEYPYDKVFSFLRKEDKCLLLVVANFDERKLRVQINIPQHAFDYLSIEQGEYRCYDLLGNMHECKRLFATYTPFAAEVPAMSGVVLKLTKR